MYFSNNNNNDKWVEHFKIKNILNLNKAIDIKIEEEEEKNKPPSINVYKSCNVMSTYIVIILFLALWGFIHCNFRWELFTTSPVQPNPVYK